MFKTLLLRFPLLYELVLRVLDYRYFISASERGTFAQHGEDKALLELLGMMNATGSFVDVGCNHPTKLSNSFLLYVEGRRGVCIDPLPRFKALYARWRPQDRFVCSAVGPVNGPMPLYEFEADVLSTLDPDLAQGYQASGYKMLRVSKTPVRTLDSILEESDLTLPLSLLSIDIEGYELPALESINLERWKPALVCLEVVTADGKKNQAAADYLLAHDYIEARNLGLNIIFKRVET
jgi:FkbM family methyltransferase